MSFEPAFSSAKRNVFLAPLNLISNDESVNPNSFTIFPVTNEINIDSKKPAFLADMSFNKKEATSESDLSLEVYGEQQQNS